ncbi:MAG: hypothetical protein ACTSQB_00315 [Candidatus Heimdallarchaeota archaeon]
MTNVTNQTLCVVDTKHMHIYNFFSEKKSATNKMDELNLAEGVENHEIMNFGTFLEKEKVFWITGEVHRITRSDFWNHLEILPPMNWKNDGILETFMMSEYMTGTFTEQYGSYCGEYISKLVDTTDPSTHIKIEDF